MTSSLIRPTAQTVELPAADAHNEPGPSSDYIPYALKPRLKPWLDAGDSSEKRATAVARITDFWLNDHRETTLNFSDLPLSRVPPALRELQALRTLHMQGNPLADIDDLLGLQPQCEVHLAEAANGQLLASRMKELRAAVDAPGYRGPRIHLDPQLEAPQSGTSLRDNRAESAPENSSATAAVPRPLHARLERPRQAGTGQAHHALVKRQRLIVSVPWNAFNPKCDICFKPVNKKHDIKLKSRNGLFLVRQVRMHGRCLVEAFPQHADAELRLKNPAGRNLDITFDLIHGGLTSAPHNSGNISLYMEIVGRVLDRKEMQPELRMQLLLRASTILSENENLRIGNRTYTKRMCLTLAMELALQHAPDSIAMISRRLLKELPEDTHRFLIGGIEYDRDDIDDWSRERNLPRPRVSAAVVNQERKMRFNNRQSVHDADTLVACAERLEKMRERLPPGRDIADAALPIRRHLQTSGASYLALHGLDLALRRKEVIDRFRESIPSTLNIVWAYIESTQDKPLKKNLRGSLTDRLIEISRENPCATGIIDRLLDVPTGVDFSIDRGIPRAQLRDELAHLAGQINERFEEEYGRELASKKKEFEAVHESTEGKSSSAPEDPDVIASEIKRDIFFASAIARYVDQRGIDRVMVLEEANHVFPAGLVM